MKHAHTCFTGKLCPFLCLLVTTFTSVYAQDFQQQRQNELQRLDLDGLGSMLFLNNAITNQAEVDYYKSLKNNLIPKTTPVSTEEWENLYERLTDADLRPAGQRMPPLNAFIEPDPARLTTNNTVPIGIINLEGIYLTGTELEDNREQKRNGRRVDFARYEKVRIVSAACLQENVYQADIAFQIKPGFLISNHPEKIDTIEIDFRNGKGFEKHVVSSALIPHRFQSVGKQSLLIRFKTDHTVYQFEMFVNVREMERIKPFKELHVTAPRVTADTAHPDQSARKMLVGAGMRIILGCDHLFDKPIIIAEGFDMGQNVGLDELQAKYRDPFAAYLGHGYDLVLVNYDDGRAAMQDNAQALQAVIDQVNAIKQGNSQNIVVGESMSGLIARYALREMEVNDEAHEVSLLICYDTPNQGANVPIGLVSLPYDVTATVLSEVILKFFAKKWRNFYSALATPAARQLLMHQTGYPNALGGKHPDFDAFRAELVGLGNGGYPQNCRNIAVTHGSVDASDRALFEHYQYGSRILRSWTPFLLQNTNIEVYTNRINEFESVLKLAAWGIFYKAVGINRKYMNPLNDDFLPGGRTNFSVPNKLIKPTKEFTFCFVPTFSAIDYQGPRTTQDERELLNIVAVNAVTGPARQTPFAAIYGGMDALDNSLHADPGVIDWANIGVAEGLIQGGGTCPPLPVPPVPTIASYNTCYPFSESRQTEGNTANISVALVTPSNGQYIHEWTILPTQQTFTTTGDQITFQAERAGNYEVICLRTYPNRRDLQSTHSVTITVSDCGGGADVVPDDQLLLIDPDMIVNDIWENDFLLTTPKPDSLAVFAHFYSTLPLKLYASTANGTFIPRSSLIAYGMLEPFAAPFQEVDPQDPLPVVLTKFTAQAEWKGSMLRWTTATEIHSDRFEIESSSNGKDWQKIASIAARNQESAMTDYSYNDPSPHAGLVYYRLKMVDSDSTFAYSSIQTVQFQSQEIAAYPNPVDNDWQLNLLISDEKVAEIVLYDLSGKLIFHSNGPLTRIDSKSLASGRYVLKIRLADGTVQNHTVVKR